MILSCWKRAVGKIDERVVPLDKGGLTPAQFEHLADVPPELEWLANLTNEKTRRAYKIDVGEFSQFLGLKRPEEFRTVTRAHVIAWRELLERRELSPPTIRRKLSALSYLFEYLCEKNAVAGNSVDGVKRPSVNSNEGLSDAQARKLLEAPPEDTLKGIRDRAILATLLYHGMRREELCTLKVKDLQSRQGGVIHFKVKGKRGKIRFVPAHPQAQRLIENYLLMAGHGDDKAGRCSAQYAQPHGRAGAASQYEFTLSKYCQEIWASHRPKPRGERPLRPFDAGHGCHQCSLP